MNSYKPDEVCASAVKALSKKVEQTLVDMGALQVEAEQCRQLSAKIDALSKGIAAASGRQTQS